jgi:hypothetical protein
VGIISHLGPPLTCPRNAVGMAPKKQLSYFFAGA